jgi:hypothetical protein
MLWLAIIFLAIIHELYNMSWLQKTFAKGLSIQVHKRTCLGLSMVTKELFKKQDANIQQKNVVKIAQQDRLAPESEIEHRQMLQDDINFDIDLPHAESSLVSTLFS